MVRRMTRKALSLFLTLPIILALSGGALAGTVALTATAASASIPCIAEPGGTATEAAGPSGSVSVEYVTFGGACYAMGEQDVYVWNWHRAPLNVVIAIGVYGGRTFWDVTRTLPAASASGPSVSMWRIPNNPYVCSVPYPQACRVPAEVFYLYASSSIGAAETLQQSTS